MKHLGLLLALALFATTTNFDLLHAQESAPGRVYLIGNSLTWDTVPERLTGQVQWHVDCGVPLPYIHARPEKPCVKTSTLWPTALRDHQYDIISVQPHFGSTLAQDVETISAWMKLQPRAVFVIHSGWGRQAQHMQELRGYAPPDQMAHSPIYFRALLAELRRLHPGREIRQTLAQHLLGKIDEDIAAGQAPLQNLPQLYRDDIHMTLTHGRYLMHNAMRRALGRPFSDTGFANLDPALKKYLDETLSWLTLSAADRALLGRILAVKDSVDRPGLLAGISNPDLQRKLRALLPEIERAAKERPNTLALEAAIREAGGRLICTPSGPQWLYLATGDTGMEIFDIPATIDLYNGNNPLKGKGGRNEKVTDDWLKRLAGVTTLRRLDLSNCAIQGDGLKHLRPLTGLRELNLTLTPVTDTALQHLADFAELRVLGLASTQCNGTGFAHLKNLRKLENVNFHFTPLNDAGLQAIAQVPISDRLWFAHTRFTDPGARHLKHLTQLRRCGMGSTERGSTGEAVEALTGLPLEDLALLDNQADPIGLAHATKIPTLRRLDLSHAPTVKDDSLKPLARMPKLEEFILGSAAVTDEGLRLLANCKSLKKLTLRGLKAITPAGLEHFRKARPEVVLETR